VIPSADLRPLIHAATGLGALLLGVLPRWAAIACAGLGVVAGWVVLPMTPLEARLRRPGEPFLCGLRTYPLAVLGLVLLLPPSRAAAAWAVLAAGDAAASLVGRRVPAPKVLGHGKATWSGTLAFLVVGAAAAAGAGRFVEATGGGPLGPAWAPLAAGAAAALVDLVRIPPDDNVPVAAAAGLALALAAA
jgi:dolichol kinase